MVREVLLGMAKDFPLLAASYIAFMLFTLPVLHVQRGYRLAVLVNVVSYLTAVVCGVAVVTSSQYTGWAIALLALMPLEIFLVTYAIVQIARARMRKSSR